MIADLAAEYAVSRDPEALARLRSAVRESPTYRADLDIATETLPLLERGDHAGVVELVHHRMPGAFFSPTAHAVLAASFEALGDPERAARERRTARLALSSVLATGDGSADRPWSVLRVSDEYDVLRSQGRVSRVQRFVTRDGRDLDQHRCDDGSEAWFDVELLGVRRRSPA